MIKDQPMNPECAGVYGQNFDKNEFKTKENATPRPWSISYKIGDAIICIGETETYGTDYYGGKLICESVEPSNAKLIVKAVNCHDDLVEALKQAKSFIKGMTGECPNIIEQALSKAESEV